MERIRLSRAEKKILRLLSIKEQKRPDMFPEHEYNPALRSLEKKNLVNVVRVDGGIVWHVSLTFEGKMYLTENPNLYNPIRWELIFSIITAICSVVALFVGCTALLS